MHLKQEKRRETVIKQRVPGFPVSTDFQWLKLNKTKRE